MSIIEAELGAVLEQGIKRKANTTKKLRNKANRVVNGATEVMVKITGFGKGAGHVQAHLTYISRNAKLDLENDRGEIFSGKAEIKEFFKDWEGDFSDGRRHKNQRDTMHMVLSMPEHTDPESVRNAVREFAKKNFANNHEYVFVLHTDEPHPHCHLTVKCLGFDGKRLNPRKADLQQWRESFADKLRDQGVDAEATPRQSRGKVRKAERSVIRHIERGDKTHKPRVSKVRAAKIKEAAAELINESKDIPNAQKPWEEKIKARQNKSRLAWLTAANALELENTYKLFNQKRVHNERPDYDNITSKQVRQVQRAAALYQSNLEKSGSKTTPRPDAGMRNLPSSGVVLHRPNSQMLLQPNALDRVGRDRRPDTEVRREGAGAYHNDGSTGQLDNYRGTVKDNKALAEKIRHFVEAMPNIDTERHELKRNLLQNSGAMKKDRYVEQGTLKENDIDR